MEKFIHSEWQNQKFMLMMQQEQCCLLNFGVVDGDESSLIDRAVRIGVKSAAAADDTYAPLLDAEGNYTASYSFHEWDVMNFSVDHGTVSKTETLSCNAC